MATWADVERIATSLPQTAPGKAWGARSRMILVHLALIPAEELAEVMTDSWLVPAPKRLARGLLASRGPQEAP
ncbi:hypothetical protein BH24ACT8_BH24ACT8_24770 [soil metagenome]